MRLRTPQLNVIAFTCAAACCAAMLAACAGCGSDEPRDDAAQAAKDQPAAAAPGKSPRVSLAQGRLSIDEHAVPLPGEPEQWRAALGPPTRSEQLAATETEPFVNVYIWDSAGIVAVERPDLAVVTKVSFVFQPSKAKSANAAQGQLIPKSAFPGTLSIDGVDFDAATTPAKVNDRIAERFGGAKFEQLKTFPHTWNIAYAAWTITAITDIQGEQLVEIAIGE